MRKGDKRQMNFIDGSLKNVEMSAGRGDSERRRRRWIARRRMGGRMGFELKKSCMLKVSESL